MFIFVVIAVLIVPISALATIPPAPLPQTGQTSCFDANGIMSCTGSSQDGEFQAGFVWPTPRFIDNGDQTVADNLTGLVWTKDANLVISRDPSFSDIYG